MGSPALRSRVGNWIGGGGGNALMDPPGLLTLAAEEGSYSITGVDTTLTYTLSPHVLAVSYDWQRAYPRAFHPSLRKPIRQALPASQTLTADAGAYVITGLDVEFDYLIFGLTLRRKISWPRAFAPSPWGHLTNWKSYNRVGSTGASYLLTAEPGVFSISGSTASVLWQRIFFMDPSQVSITGTAANLIKGKLLTAEEGSFAITGTAISFSNVIVADPGSFVISSPGVDVTYSAEPPKKQKLFGTPSYPRKVRKPWAPAGNDIVNEKE